MTVTPPGPRNAATALKQAGPRRDDENLVLGLGGCHQERVSETAFLLTSALGREFVGRESIQAEGQVAEGLALDGAEAEGHCPTPWCLRSELPPSIRLYTFQSLPVSLQYLCACHVLEGRGGLSRSC